MELWARTVGDSTFRCIPEPLLFYRDVGVSQLKKYLASSAQMRTMVGSGQIVGMSRAQRFSVIGRSRAKDLAYVAMHAIGREEWLVRRRSRPLTTYQIQIAEAVLRKVLSTDIPERKQKQ